MAPESGAGGGAPDAAAESWGVGGVVGDGRYRLTHRLGRGGMAEVFAAEDVRLGRTVAVKLLRADLAEDPVSKARFTREAQSVAGLNHHAIVAVYDSGEDLVGGRPVPYIVMELVEGRTIRDLLLSAEAPGPEQALIIVSGVLEALAYSHQHGIVHRDIKPANVIITHGGAVKVMDFGIARALHGAQSTMTQTGMVMGTPQYLSPEQALGKAVDHRSDLYATGCLLYELLALRPPFTGETPLSVVYQHVQDAPVPPSDVTGSVPPELDGLVMRSLAKEPDDRFQSAEEMRGLIQYALQMLQQQGGYTGTWNTGPIEVHDGGRTPAGGVAATTAMGHPMHGETAQRPILPPVNPDDGGYDGGAGGGGYGQGGSYGSQGGGNGGRGKVWLFAALAVVAVVAGVAFALSKAGGNGGGGTENKTPTVTTSPSTKTSEEPTPSQEPTQDQTQDPGTSSGGSTREPWTEQPTRQPDWPTGTPTTETPTEPATTPPVDPTDTPTKTSEPTTRPPSTPATETPGNPSGGGDGGDDGDDGGTGTQPPATSGASG
ncbi:serine/threonine protein kinase [Streptomyces cinereoruber]|uniref:non-specific serine/threonine protein kinase n=1 Tax=Streptomyces cinereoruber TaxID=67260 RepID=A0AAV4KMZ4_9ACTN|nr:MULTISPECIES: protein kinase [Streptomyces]AVH96564.1 serine/threonine protein kinase [Streptomyces sp. WAC00288]KYG55200.1 serine/threonine protein kinase [Streptomyces sp. WAC04657]MBB4159828.1 tRNA A-37 threonylcarbamoyl transferase component Bud32 [Streptomyces cinereoruber]MBY8817805.1 protein kinase [Streptomyces cinereoruber]NIH60536.1 tRNA A-37 threonylcarbamoyl transferase component Bud32 [Streptomyces cinereoruber]